MSCKAVLPETAAILQILPFFIVVNQRQEMHVIAITWARGGVWYKPRGLSAICAMHPECTCYYVPRAWQHNCLSIKHKNEQTPYRHSSISSLFYLHSITVQYINWHGPTNGLQDTKMLGPDHALLQNSPTHALLLKNSPTPTAVQNSSTAPQNQAKELVFTITPLQKQLESFEKKSRFYMLI